MEQRDIYLHPVVCMAQYVKQFQSTFRVTPYCPYYIYLTALIRPVCSLQATKKGRCGCRARCPRIQSLAAFRCGHLNSK